MKYCKRILSVFLCMLLSFIAICMSVPTKVYAETYTQLSVVPDLYLTGDICINVCKGAKNLYIGDYVAYQTWTEDMYFGPYTQYISMLSGVTYKSSKPAVASVDKKTGKVNAKKTGITKITVKYLNHQISFSLRVVSEENFENVVYGTPEEQIKYAKKLAAAFLRQSGNALKITKSNRYKLLSASKLYYPYSPQGYTTSLYGNECYVFSPECSRASAIVSAVYTHGETCSPFSLKSHFPTTNRFDVKSITAKAGKKDVTVAFEKKITADQMFGIQYIYSWDTLVTEKSTCTIPVEVYNLHTDRSYYGIASFKKGTAKMTVKLKNHKLKKGNVYRLHLKESNQTYNYYEMSFDDYTFTVK